MTWAELGKLIVNMPESELAKTVYYREPWDEAAPNPLELRVSLRKTSQKNSEPHIQVEYDEDFWGGDYDRVGCFALVKLSDVDRLGSVKAAFRATTGIDPVHIIHYSEDEFYDASGDLLE